jgi:hypothetical protein
MPNVGHLINESRVNLLNEKSHAKEGEADSSSINVLKMSLSVLFKQAK